MRTITGDIGRVVLLAVNVNCVLNGLAYVLNFPVFKVDCYIKEVDKFLVCFNCDS